MNQEVFSDIESRLFQQQKPQPKPQPKYKVETDTPEQVTRIKTQAGTTLVTVETVNHIEVATWICHLLNSKP